MYVKMAMSDCSLGRPGSVALFRYPTTSTLITFSLFQDFSIAKIRDGPKRNEEISMKMVSYESYCPLGTEIPLFKREILF